MALAVRAQQPPGYVVLGAAPRPVALHAGPSQLVPNAPGPDVAAEAAFGHAPDMHGVVADSGQAFRGLVPEQPVAPSTVASLQASGTTAGAHHDPTGDRLVGGLVAGATVGCLWHGCCWGAGLGIVGMLMQKEALKQEAVVSMPAGDGIVRPLTTQEVRVKLWKAGPTAPLTQDGFALVASDQRRDQMHTFMRRVVAALGGQVKNPKAFNDSFVPRCYGIDTTPSRWRQCASVQRGGKPIPDLSEAVVVLQEEEVTSGVSFPQRQNARR